MSYQRDSFGLTLNQRLFCEIYAADKKKMLQKPQERLDIAKIRLAQLLMRT